MRVILTPAGHFLNKKKCSVFSLDVWPVSSSHVVSGGQDGKLILWEITDTQTTEKQQEKKHTGAVLTVRYAPDGYVLASGADDGEIIIWGVQVINQAPRVFPKKRIPAHRSDVSALAWSSKYLVSGGYDGAVIVYERKSFGVVKTLRKHAKECKGISFSPDGSYLVTYGDEGEVYLYNSRLERIARNPAPFAEVRRESFFCRISWSPDGKWIAAGCSGALPDTDKAAENPPQEKESPRQICPEYAVHGIAILRNTLALEYLMLGHVSPVEVSAFNPRLWKKNKDASDASYLIAAASQDRSVSIWGSERDAPLFLLKEVSEQPILDLRWSSDGRTLTGCAYDGTIFRLVFREDELGTPVDPVVDYGMCLPYAKPRALSELPNQKHEFPSAGKPIGEKPGEEGEKKQQPVPETPASAHRKIVPRLIAPLRVAEKGEYIEGPRIILCPGHGSPGAQPEAERESQVDPASPPSTSVSNGDCMYQIVLQKGVLHVKKNGNEWFSTGCGRTVMFAADKLLLVSVARVGSGSPDTVWIYNIEICAQVLPCIPFSRVLAVDALDESVLVVAPDGFLVLNLCRNVSYRDSLVRGLELVNIILDRKYFLIALYGDGTTMFYDPSRKCWFVLDACGSQDLSSIWGRISGRCQAPSQEKQEKEEWKSPEDLEDTGLLESLENRLLAGIGFSDWTDVEGTLSRLSRAVFSTRELQRGQLNRLDGIFEMLVSFGGPQGLSLTKSVLEDLSRAPHMTKYVYFKQKELEKTQGRTDAQE